LDIALEYQNPDATPGAKLQFAVMLNTGEDEIAANIRVNSARDLPWFEVRAEHQGVAIIVGGGPSAGDHLDDIRHLAAQGATVFAVNGASRWLRERGIMPNYQFIIDAKEETASLVDPDALAHIFASQVNPKTMEAAPAPIVCHLGSANLQDHLPAERAAQGGYTTLGGGGITGGNLSLALAFADGFRELHLFGLDSCHRGGASHAYAQPMNGVVPCVECEIEGRTFVASLPMKVQADKLMNITAQLRAEGCAVSVYGDGLFQAMFNHRHWHRKG
jgi:hypothetical protein